MGAAKKVRVSSSNEETIWLAAILLFYIGVFMFPLKLRYGILYYRTPFRYAGWANLLMVIVLIMMMMTKKQYEISDKILIIIWLALLIPFFYSNITGKIDPTKVFAAVINIWMPLFILLQRMDRSYRHKVIRVFLIIFNCLTILFLFLAVCEKMTGGKIFEHIALFYKQHHMRGMNFKTYKKFMGGNPFRFCSLWGHALTHSLQFNMFFVLNDIYYRSIKKKYPTFLFFLVALAGQVLVASKTGIVVVLVYSVIALWNQKKWFIVYAATGAAMFAGGVFRSLIYRFTHSPLTTGRVTKLRAYLKSGLYPIKLLTGYGTGISFVKEMQKYKPAFEFPVLMHAINYGVVFSILYLGSIFVIFTIPAIKNRQIASWLGLSLLFVQNNTYNGFSLCSQDLMWFFAIVLLMAIHLMEMAGEKEASEQGGSVD